MKSLGPKYPDVKVMVITFCTHYLQPQSYLRGSVCHYLVGLTLEDFVILIGLKRGVFDKPMPTSTALIHWGLHLLRASFDPTIIKIYLWKRLFWQRYFCRIKIYHGEGHGRKYQQVSKNRKLPWWTHCKNVWWIEWYGHHSSGIWSITPWLVILFGKD